MNAQTNQAAIDWITRTLAVLATLCVSTVCVLAYRGIQVPPELNTLTGGLVGSLASMLVKTTATDHGPTPVTVENADSHPVPVNDTK